MGKSVKRFAFSQFAKENEWSKELKQTVAWGECVTCLRADIDVHGYSVRSDNWRYTEWVQWNKTSLRPEWDNVIGRELYNHTGDDGSDFDKATPDANLWNMSHTNLELAQNLSKVLHEQFNNDHLPPMTLAPSSVAFV